MTIIKKIFGSLFLLLSMPIFAFSSANVNQTWLGLAALYHAFSVHNANTFGIVCA
jgi:hypothetical protein